MLKRWHVFKMVLMVALIMSMVSVGTVNAAVSNFYPVIAPNGADPSVYKHSDGYYYSTFTTGGNVTLWRSKSLAGLYSGTVSSGNRMVIWTPPATGAYSKNIWAPEIQFINNKWYVYFAADNGNNVNHRMYALENTSANPFQGTWTFKGKINPPDNDDWAIDGVVLNQAGSLYFIWSGWEGTIKNQHIYIAPMSDPLTISGSRVKIASPTFSWETNTTPQVNEGPQVIVKNGKISIVYSASGSWTNNYCLALITASTSSNLLQASSWTKKNTPIFQSSNGIFGPGHHSFTTSPDGTEDWIVYHAARWSGSGWTRAIHAKPFSWNADNTPNLGTPASRNSTISLPSGDYTHERYQAENALLSNGPVVKSLSGASGGKAVGSIDFTNSYVEFTVNVPSTGWYAMTTRYDSGSATDIDATLNVSVNGGTAESMIMRSTRWGNWSNTATQVYLTSGTNTIRFTKGDGYAQLDHIDIFKLQ
ncbi:family 43 glycosylhydrolase [Paenibacillus sp. PL2-23]|uniref:family 43 glycosylhydrolase n=1 Tax=Paenibacillus sp. PL2-23 TaxID=2100729 RepID=UPI0030F4D269